MDLTPIVTIDRRVRMPSPKGRGHGVGFCSWLMKAMVFQIKTYRTLHRNRQTPADSLLGRGSTASEHEEPL